jgi:hypothetical protein
MMKPLAMAVLKGRWDDWEVCLETPDSDPFGFVGGSEVEPVQGTQAVRIWLAGRRLPGQYSPGHLFVPCAASEAGVGCPNSRTNCLLTP